MSVYASRFRMPCRHCGNHLNHGQQGSPFGSEHGTGILLRLIRENRWYRLAPSRHFPEQYPDMLVPPTQGMPDCPIGQADCPKLRDFVAG
jgi:hypothetical protein